MTISNKGNSAYTTCQEDISDELQNYASSNGNEIHYFKDIICECEHTGDCPVDFYTHKEVL